MSPALIKRIWHTAFWLFLLSQAFFLINIQYPIKLDFDEFHYIPAAKEFLALGNNPNWEHPPLAKILIAMGIAIFGDQPIGWRFSSVVFGSLTLVGMYVWATAIFKSTRAGLYAALLTAANQLLYVQARIAMLDTFMMAFMVWAFAALAALWSFEFKRTHARRIALFAGFCFGAALACKWAALVAWGIGVGWVITARVFDHLSNASPQPPEKMKNSSPLAQAVWGPFLGLSLFDWILALGAVPLIIYFVTFLPYLFYHRVPAYTFLDLFRMQYEMYDGQLRVVTDHPYMSSWLSWPWMVRPIWYAFDAEGVAREWVRGVLLLGNPAVVWGGLLAIAFCLYDTVTRRSRAAWIITTAYFGLYLCWAVIPRKISFYYYYYPSAMVLSLALTHSIERLEEALKPAFVSALWIRWLFLAVCLALFCYFYPILAALKIPADAFRPYMWSQRWI